MTYSLKNVSKFLGVSGYILFGCIGVYRGVSGC